MREVVVALLSAIVVVLMLAMPVSAGSKTVAFADREGDLGKPLYSGGEGNHEWGDPFSWYSGNCPMANAGYLDMITGWVAVKNDRATLGLTLASPIPTCSELPQGVSEVRWEWLLYTTLDVMPAYRVDVVCDGTDFNAVLVDRTSGYPPFALKDLDFVAERNVLTVTTSLADIPGVVAWFSQTVVLYGSPWPLDQWASAGGWIVPDMTDYQGSLAGWWPWMAMP